MTWNRLYALGRHSTRWYVRFYPNVGFMIPWTRGRRLRWSKYYGWTVR